MQRVEVIIFLVTFAFVEVLGECDQCQTENPVACHNETIYSLCLNGKPTLDYVSCPTDYVCTADVFVCYPRSTATPSCVRNEAAKLEISNCGICASKGKVFACLDERTIAFCFGDDEPHYESLSYCPEGTVCDLNSGSKFCSDKTKIVPSCRQSQWEQPTTTSPQTLTKTASEAIPKTTPRSPTTTSSTTQTTTTSRISTPTSPTPITETTRVSGATATKISTTTISPIPETTTTPSSTTTTSSTPQTTTTPDPETTKTLPTKITTTTTVSEPTTTKMLTTPISLTPEITTSTIPTITTSPTPITTRRPTITNIPQTISTTNTGTTATTSAPTTTISRSETTTQAPTTTSMPTTTTTASPGTTKPEPTSATEPILTPEERCELNGKQVSIPESNDPTCKGYIVCSKPASTWIATQTKCSANQWFDPILAICSPNYKCPTLGTTSETTTITATANAPVPTIATISIPTTTITPRPATTKPEPTSTTEPILTPEERCELNGKQVSIPESNDPTCKGYIVCSKPASTWIATQTKCSANQWFDPILAICSANYKCPTLGTTSETTTITATANAPVPTIATISISTTTITTRPATTKPEPTSTTEPILTPEERCELNGKQVSIPESNDPTCKGYIVCSKPASTWIATQTKCSANQWFDPILAICSPNYKCPTLGTTSETTTITATANAPVPTIATISIPTTTITTRPATTKPEPTSTTEPILTPEERCELNGKQVSIPESNDPTCKGYIVCSKPASTWIATQTKCSANQWFDPILAICSPNYKCPTLGTTSETTTITATANAPVPTIATISIPTTTITTRPATTKPEPTSTTEPILTPEERCELNGKQVSIPESNDPTCKGYIVCSKPASTWIATQTKCSANQWFDPILAICSANYKCPTLGTTSETTTISATANAPVPTIATTTSTTKTTTTPAPTTTTGSALTPAEFCERNGKQAASLPQLSDPTCKGYIVCTKPASTWIASERQCATNKLFDPDLGKCSGTYNCPT